MMIEPKAFQRRLGVNDDGVPNDIATAGWA